MAEKYYDITVGLVGGGVRNFRGRYLPELETNNWHYYEKNNGRIVHFRKDQMVYVDGGTIAHVKDAERIKNHVKVQQSYTNPMSIHNRR